MNVIINKLKLLVYLGVYKEEQQTRRQVLVTIAFDYFPDKVVKDELSSVVDYQQLSLHIMDSVKDKRYQLIETLAHDVLREVLQHELIAQARVEVYKPDAFMQAEGVNVTVSKSKLV